MIRPWVLQSDQPLTLLLHAWVTQTSIHNPHTSSTDRGSIIEKGGGGYPERFRHCQV